jgi:Skp family chaperone for outer membrane proteins
MNPQPDAVPPADQVDPGQPAEAADQPDPNEPRRQVALPPMPTLPPLAKGNPPPTPVLGVLGVPDVMRASIAAQQVERMIGERRAKFQADAQKEQAAWREMQQSFADQRSKLTPDQIRLRERDLQQRITTAQRTFRDRDRIIQDAARFGLAQIEQTMVAVIRQVAESRGMNLVLHRAQVALNVNEYDITNEVTAQLNKVLPSVQIPADGAPIPTVALAPSGSSTSTALANGAAASAPAPATGPVPGAAPPAAGAAPLAPPVVSAPNPAGAKPATKP